jgi:hypothetical protein
MLSIEFKDFRQLHEGVIFYGDTERRCLVEMIYSKNVVSILSSNRLCIELCSMRIVAANARVVRQTTSLLQGQCLGFGCLGKHGKGTKQDGSIAPIMTPARTIEISTDTLI